MTASAESLPARPRIKPIYDVLYLDGRIRLGSGPAYISEIEDEDGRYGGLVRLLDGTRSIAQLAEELAGRLKPDEVNDGVAILYENGFIEDAALSPPPELSERDIQRYAPNLNFLS